MKCKQVTYQDKCSCATRAPKRRGYDADEVISFVPDLGGCKINDPEPVYTEHVYTVDGTNPCTTDAPMLIWTHYPYVLKQSQR